MYEVMIVDDMEIFRRQLSRMKIWTKQDKFNITCEAHDGVDAIRKLSQKSVDVVITDIKMPKMDGIELLREIKAEKLCRCVILVSEYTEFEYARQGIILGAFDYLVKPITEESIENMLSRIYEYLQNNKEEYYPEVEEKHLIDGLLSMAEDIEHRQYQVIGAVEELAGKSYIQMGVLLSKILKNTFNKVLENNSWLDGLIFNLERAEKKLTSYGEKYMLNASFSAYIREIQISLKKYKLGDENSLTRRVCEYVLERPFEKVSLSDTAAKCFVNKTYLSHTFKQDTGISFVDYVTMYKMEKAKHMVEYTDMRFFEIANKLGYDDADYFSRSFKSIYGVSPTEYKKVGITGI